MKRIFHNIFYSSKSTMLLFAAVTIGWLPSYSQQTKKSPLQLGDQYFAMGEYYTAALLYGQFLNPPKNQHSPTGFPINSRRGQTAVTGNASRTEILFKQAESYRLANYWQEAANAYKECAEKNPEQYRSANYWYAVCKRSLAHYDTAELAIKKYLSTATESDKYKADAQSELQTLQYIRQQLSRADSVLIKTKKLDLSIGTERGAWAPAHISGNQFILSSTQPDPNAQKETNPNRSRLFSATITNGAVSALTPLAITSSDAAINQGAATISKDGKYLYFSQWKQEKGKTISSILYSVKEGSGWSVPKTLTSVNQRGSNSKQPFITADGNFLYFSSDRGGGAGGFDIWYAPINGDGSVGQAVNAGPAINTANDEQAPFYHTSSSTLVFSSNRKPGMGGYDMFAAHGSETNWSVAENMGHPLSSARDDIYFSAPEEKPLLSDAIFSSDRGKGCCLESYSFSKLPKAKRVFGTIRDCGNDTPLANAEVVMKDKEGNSWKATTSDDGNYFFDIAAGANTNFNFTVTKALYLVKSITPSLAKTDESDLLVDKLTNQDICLEKKPVEEKLVIKAENVVTLYFDFDKSVLKPDALEKLDSIYNVLTETPIATIQISGYTDGRGTVAYNNKLSDKRARACAEYLISKGIEAARITFVSFGACCPVEMELINGRDNAAGRSRNRRALINIKKD